jgi:hypothetical protein
MANNALQNQNQFTQTPMLGQLTQDPQPNTLVCQINPAGTAVYVAGQPVVLVDTAGAQFLVDVPAALTNGPVIGVICYSKQKNQYVPGDQVEVAARGNIIFLEASAAIARGTQVAATPTASLTTDPTVATDTTNGHYILGAALGKATAANQLIRVQIAPGVQTGGALAPTVP